MSRRPELQILDGALRGRRFAVRDGGMRLGRSSSNDIQIPDEELSRNHCQLETVGENSIRIVDLTSANGTFVNGVEIGAKPTELRVGDVIEVGATHIKVVGEEAPAAPPAAAGAVDLGFGPAPQRVPPSPKRGSTMRKVLWSFAFLLAVAAAGAWWFKFREIAPAPVENVEVVEKLCEVTYEKVEADSEGIFRFEMALAPDGVLRATVDDVPRENRHLTKSLPLNEKALAELGEILDWKRLREFDREYIGAEPDPPSLTSWNLRVVYSNRARSVRIVNTQEPETFRQVRERLEAFAKNELGIWAMQYSRDKLVALADSAIELGRSKWTDRDVNHGNLFEAVAAYREAIFYLDTVNPKPDCIGLARRGLEDATAELDRRYRDQRFLANRAINLGQWEEARRELSILLELVPDRNDERNREAASKLMDVERRLKGGK